MPVCADHAVYRNGHSACVRAVMFQLLYEEDTNSYWHAKYNANKWKGFNFGDSKNYQQLYRAIWQYETESFVEICSVIDGKNIDIFMVFNLGDSENKWEQSYLRVLRP